jgi:N-carbamoylputrescine amidase
VLRVTVCELPDGAAELEPAWAGLVQHVRAEAADLVVLPEAPFDPWLAEVPAFDPDRWRQAVVAHQRWLPRLADLAPSVVLATRPVERGGRRVNEGFCWSAEAGYRAVHEKAVLPAEPGCWETVWFDRGDGEFRPADAGPATVGLLVCSELWFFERARAYGRAGAALLVTPRATSGEWPDRWLLAGQMAAVVGGAFSVSSNRVDPADPARFAGRGWVVDPEGRVLGETCAATPYRTFGLDMDQVTRARASYPRTLVG